MMMLECWDAGMLGCWDAGMLAPVKLAQLNRRRRFHPGVLEEDTHGRPGKLRWPSAFHGVNMLG